MCKFLILCFLLLVVIFRADANVASQKPFATKITVHNSAYHISIDSSKLTVRKYNADSLSQYRNSPEFTYKENVKIHFSLWERFWQWFWEMIARLFANQKPSGNISFSFINFILYVLAFAFLGMILFIIFRIAGLDLSNIFNKEPKDVALPYTESLENIHLITFDDEIEKALSQRNYRLAVRLLYLKTLKQLDEAHLISWKIEKTNSAYLNELTNMDQRRSFSVLTRQFEYVWYGDFPIDSRSFQNINTLFHDFNLTAK